MLCVICWQTHAGRYSTVSSWSHSRSRCLCMTAVAVSSRSPCLCMPNVQILWLSAYSISVSSSLHTVLIITVTDVILCVEKTLEIHSYCKQVNQPKTPQSNLSSAIDKNVTILTKPLYHDICQQGAALKQKALSQTVSLRSDPHKKTSTTTLTRVIAQRVELSEMHEKSLVVWVIHFSC